MRARIGMTDSNTTFTEVILTASLEVARDRMSASSTAVIAERG